MRCVNCHRANLRTNANIGFALDWRYRAGTGVPKGVSTALMDEVGLVSFITLFLAEMRKRKVVSGQMQDPFILLFLDLTSYH